MNPKFMTFTCLLLFYSSVNSIEIKSSFLYCKTNAKIDELNVEPLNQLFNVDPNKSHLKIDSNNVSKVFYKDSNKIIYECSCEKVDNFEIMDYERSSCIRDLFGSFKDKNNAKLYGFLNSDRIISDNSVQEDCQKEKIFDNLLKDTIFKLINNKIKIESKQITTKSEKLQNEININPTLIKDIVNYLNENKKMTSFEIIFSFFMGTIFLIIIAFNYFCKKNSANSKNNDVVSNDNFRTIEMEKSIDIKSGTK